MKKDSYTWEDLDKAWWEGFDNAKNKMEKRIAELEEKISVLLSCKNCPENKGGLICAKEYENKCLAQKIQYIKELQEENAQWKQRNETLKDALEHARKIYGDELEKSYKEIAELKADNRIAELEAQIEEMKADVNTNIKVAQQKKDWLMESKLVSMILQWEGKIKTTKEEVNNEEWYVIFNMNCEYEICRMCPKSGLFKGSYEECEKWIEQNS